MSFSIPEGFSHSDNIIRSFRWVLSLFSSILTQVWILVIEPVISLLSGILCSSILTIGKSKAVRILCGKNHSSKMTNQIRDCIMNQSEFNEVCINCFCHRQIGVMLRRHEKFDVDYAVQLFMKAAKVNINASYYNESYDK